MIVSEVGTIERLLQQPRSTQSSIESGAACTGADPERLIPILASTYLYWYPRKRRAVLANYLQEEGVWRTTSGDTPLPKGQAEAGQYHYRGWLSASEDPVAGDCLWTGHRLSQGRPIAHHCTICY